MTPPLSGEASRVFDSKLFRDHSKLKNQVKTDKFVVDILASPERGGNAAVGDGGGVGIANYLEFVKFSNLLIYS